MKRCLQTVLLGLVLSAPNGFAESYQVEAGGSYEGDDRDDFEITTVNLYGVYFLAAVKTDERPLAEAAFFAKSSFVRADYIDRERKLDRVGFRDITVDTDGIGIGGRYVMPEDDIIIEAGLLSAISTVCRWAAASTSPMIRR